MKKAKRKLEEVVTVAAGVILADLVLPILKDTSKKIERYVKKTGARDDND